MATDIKETRITFQSTEGDRLAGILTEPADTSPPPTLQTSKPFNPQHCAILCHGFASHKQGFHFPAIAEHLASNLGMSSLRFDYAGNMDSSGEFRFGGFLKVHHVSMAVVTPPCYKLVENLYMLLTLQHPSVVETREASTRGAFSTTASTALLVYLMFFYTGCGLVKQQTSRQRVLMFAPSTQLHLVSNIALVQAQPSMVCTACRHL